MRNIFIYFVLITLLAACSSEMPMVVENEPVEPIEAKAVCLKLSCLSGNDAEKSPESIMVSPATHADVNAQPIIDMSPPQSSLDSVYFDHNSFAVRESDKHIIQAHASYLTEHPDRKVHIEGNTDETGSNEYNLALGQSRAEGIKQMLLLVGVKEEQIITTSLGEEVPKARGHDELSWSQNRRVDFNY